MRVTAKANSNIALIKYWGKRDASLNLPAVGSISVTLDGLSTQTSVWFKTGLGKDRLLLNGTEESGLALDRVSRFLNIIRMRAGTSLKAFVESSNNFPTAAGLASSASAFAALAVASSKAAGLTLTEAELSELSRRGSGSAARSIFGGFVEMHRGEKPDGSDSIAEPLADKAFWDLRLLIAVTSEKAKTTDSTSGMTQSKASSPYYPVWVDTAEADLAEMRSVLLAKDFQKVGEISEYSCLKMHALAQSGRPGVVYWNGATVKVMHAVRELRQSGIPVYFTIDAGPQVKVLCLPENEQVVNEMLQLIPGVLRIIKTRPGDGIQIIEAAE